MIARFAVLALILGVAVGCGGAAGIHAVPVKGKVVKGNEPFRLKKAPNPPLPPGESPIHIKFTALGEGQIAGGFDVHVDPETGTFEMLGPTGKGLPPGKYQVVVLVKGSGMPGANRLPTHPPAENEPDEALTSLEGKEFARTEITVPPEGTTDLVIDVSKKK
jgi:hypothetical protein